MGQQGTRRALRAEEEGHDSAVAAPRPFWSGTITFGLVSVPVNLYSAVRSGGIRTRLLTPDGTPVARRYFCPKEEKDVPQDELARGYQVDKDEYVVITDEELEAIAPRKSRDIDLRRFVDGGELDPFLFERAFALTPGGESHKAYRLLADVMERENKAGIATFVMRDKEYLVAILAHDGLLRAETLRFADEIRSPAQVGLPRPADAPAKLVCALERTIRNADKPDVARSELSDERTHNLEKLIERKRRARENVIEAPVVAEEQDTDEEVGDVDLLDAIRRSLRDAREGGDSGRKARASARTPAKSARARSKPSKSAARATKRTTTKRAKAR